MKVGEGVHRSVLQIILSKFKITVYADNPTISPIFVVKELLDFRQGNTSTGIDGRVHNCQS